MATACVAGRLQCCETHFKELQEILFPAAPASVTSNTQEFRIISGSCGRSIVQKSERHQLQWFPMCGSVTDAENRSAARVEWSCRQVVPPGTCTLQLWQGLSQLDAEEEGTKVDKRDQRGGYLRP